MEKDERASFEDLHVSYPDESVTEDIYQFSEIDVLTFPIFPLQRKILHKV